VGIDLTKDEILYVEKCVADAAIILEREALENESLALGENKNVINAGGR
jgi:hypothetical protein